MKDNSSIHSPTTPHQVQTEILGEQYTITGDINEEYMLSISNYLQIKLTELHKMDRNLKSNQLVLLATMNIIDELFQTQKQLDQIPMYSRDMERAQARTEILIKKIEETLIGEDSIYDKPSPTSL